MPAGLKSEEVNQYFSSFGFRVECFIQFLQNEQQVFVKTGKVYCPSRLAKSLLAETAHNVNGTYFELEDPAKSDWRDRSFYLLASHPLPKFSKRDAKLYFSRLAMEQGIDMKLEFQEQSINWWGNLPVTIYFLKKEDAHLVLQMSHIINNVTIQIYPINSSNESSQQLSQGFITKRQNESNDPAFKPFDKGYRTVELPIKGKAERNPSSSGITQPNHTIVSQGRLVQQSELQRVSNNNHPNAMSSPSPGIYSEGSAKELYQSQSGLSSTNDVYNQKPYINIDQDQIPAHPQANSKTTLTKNSQRRQKELTMTDRDGSISGYSASLSRSQHEQAAHTPPQDTRSPLLRNHRPSGFCNQQAELWSCGDSEGHLPSQHSIPEEESHWDWPSHNIPINTNEYHQSVQYNQFAGNYPIEWSSGYPIPNQQLYEGHKPNPSPNQQHLVREIAKQQQPIYSTKVGPNNYDNAKATQPSSTSRSTNGPLKESQSLSRTEILNLKLKHYQLRIFSSASQDVDDPLYFSPTDVALHEGILPISETPMAPRVYSTSRLLGLFGRRILGSPENLNYAEASNSSRYPLVTLDGQAKTSQNHYLYRPWSPVNPCIQQRAIGFLSEIALKALPATASIDDKFNVMAQVEFKFRALPTLTSWREMTKKENPATRLMQQAPTATSAHSVSIAAASMGKHSIPEAETGSQASLYTLLGRQAIPALYG